MLGNKLGVDSYKLLLVYSLTAKASKYIKHQRPCASSQQMNRNAWFMGLKILGRVGSRAGVLSGVCAPAL